jgi:hypothetical protein
VFRIVNKLRWKEIDIGIIVMKKEIDAENLTNQTNLGQKGNRNRVGVDKIDG